MTIKGVGIPADFGERITAARDGEASYRQHVEPIIDWAVAEFGSLRLAADGLRQLRWDDGTSPAGFELIGRAITTIVSRIR